MSNSGARADATPLSTAGAGSSVFRLHNSRANGRRSASLRVQVLKSARTATIRWGADVALDERWRAARQGSKPDCGKVRRYILCSTVKL